MDPAAVMSVGKAAGIIFVFEALFLGDALAFLLCRAGRRFFRLLCSVGFGLLAGQLGSFCITSGLGFTRYWCSASCSRC
ncbi:hypothetical protein [Aeromonas veronii]|uniref:hypothetical protein n=1 Tax=Aeromonas veronii TaxID=654 RepID=UPI001F417E28|nr:hypothetical protein [Aeromonas veronii]